MFNRLCAWLWFFLPDKCEMPDCSRTGVRGNENIIDGKRVCDYCHAKMISARAASLELAKRPTWT